MTWSPHLRRHGQDLRRGLLALVDDTSSPRSTATTSLGDRALRMLKKAGPPTVPAAGVMAALPARELGAAC
ncbi:hypothetical protein [Ornithinimicrobium avium]|nr:hypothetical protein [Ornithinimicrobium avium]